MRDVLKAVIVEDSDDDATLIARTIETAGYALTWVRVETEIDLRNTLASTQWDIVLSDYRLPGFNAPAALQTVKEIDPDIPFIVISGTIGEHTAVEMMKAGAHDYLMKNNLTRLTSAIERELNEVEIRREKTRATLALMKSEETYRTLVETSPDAIIMTSQDGTICKANRHAAKISGVDTADGLIGERIHSLASASDADTRMRIQTVLVAGSCQQQEMVLKRRGGARYWGEVSAATIKDAENNVSQGLIFIVRDITDRKKLQLKLTEADRMASIGVLSAGVAHEINNPLTYVLNAVDNMAEAFPDIVEAFAAFKRLSTTVPFLASDDTFQKVDNIHIDQLMSQLCNAQLGVRRIVDIIKDIKVFSRVRDMDRRPVYINRVLNSAINIAYNEIKYRAELHRDIASVPAVLANEGRLSQVFLNLLINASQALQEGATSKNRIVVKTGVKAGQVFATVSDNGIGIDAAHMSQIFDPFFTTKPSGVGTGLGLAISQNIISEYGGSISVSSTPGVGTTFTVSLPMQAAEVTPTVSDKGPCYVASTQMRGRILVVDDDSLIRDALKNMLGKEHDVHVVASVPEAIRTLCEDSIFDVILCDLLMPDVSGIELYKWLEQNSSPLTGRVIFMTAGPLQNDMRSMLSKKAPPQIEKPFRVEILKQEINEMLKRNRPVMNPGSLEEAGSPYAFSVRASR